MESTRSLSSSIVTPTTVTAVGAAATTNTIKMLANESFTKDCCNGMAVADKNSNNVNLIDYTSNEMFTSKIEPLPYASLALASTTATATVTKLTSTPFTSFQYSNMNVNNKNNPFLIDDTKHTDEFTQSKMKICLVVSPPTNKLLQVCIYCGCVEMYC